MRLTLKFIVFLLTFTVGFSSFQLVSPTASKNHQCPRYAGIDPAERYFTLEEGKRMIGKKVKFIRQANFPENNGRIAGLDLIDNDKFFAIVDWNITPDTGIEGLRWYSKDYIDADFVVE